jgi:ketosteroid isomerase-like protein
MTKRSLAIVTLVILALTVPPSMLAQQNSKAEKEVRAVLDELTQANLKGGAEAATIMDKYLADDMVRIPSNGSIFTKADMVDGFKTGKIKVEQMDLSDVKIHMYGNTAVVTGVISAKSTVIDASYNNKNRFSRVFVKRGGVWQSVLYQNTPIKQ